MIDINSAKPLFRRQLDSLTRINRYEKTKTKMRAGTNQGKTKRSKSRYDKLFPLFKLHKLDQIDGLQYESGIAMKEATKLAKYLSCSSMKNPPGAPMESLKC